MASRSGWMNWFADFGRGVDLGVGRDKSARFHQFNGGDVEVGGFNQEVGARDSEVGGTARTCPTLLARHALLALRAVFVFLTASTLMASMAGAGDGNLEALEEQAFKQAAALADPSIVRIETVGGLEQIDNVLLASGPTSGVVVSSDGFVISSSFNFVAKPASILVTLPDGRRLAAKQVASDQSRLLTLLKIDVTGLTPAKPAPRDQIQVGQWALALGRTLDNSTPSLSVGIVSALNRVWGKAIQTDAKTSPVNYGGALIDIEGRVLGVIAPLSPSGGGEMAGVEWYDGGIGFAIPLEDIYESLEQLKQGTDLLPGLMGITFVGGQALNVPVVVDRVRYNSPAQQAGLKAKDRIVEADGEKIVRVAQFKQVLGRKYAGDSVKLVAIRGEESIPIEVSLVGQLVPYEFPFLGILPRRKSVSTDPVTNFKENTSDAAVSDEAGPSAGVEIRFVFAKSPAESAGLTRGDRILKFNGTDVTNARSLMDLVGRNRPGERGTLTYVRDGQTTSEEVTLGSLLEEVVQDLPTEIMIPPSRLIREDQEKKQDRPDADDSKPPTEKKADQTPKIEISYTGSKTGRFTATLEGHDHDYWGYVPETYSDANTYGLVVWIHPGDDTMEATIFKQWKSICDRRGLILIAPKAEKPMGWQPGEAEFIKALIQDTRLKYAIDSSRIVLHSSGTGAGITWLVAMKNRDVVRGVVVCGAPYVGPTPDNEPDFRQQFFFVCGDGDKMLAKVKSTVGLLRKLKFPVAFDTVKGLGTKYPADETIEAIGRWVDSLDRI